MRNTWIVSYDITDEKRLRKVFKCCKGYGIHLQYSVFECDLTAAEKVSFETALRELIQHDADQVLFIDLGPAETRGERVIQSLGIPYVKMDEACYVV